MKKILIASFLFSTCLVITAGCTSNNYTSKESETSHLAQVIAEEKVELAETKVDVTLDGAIKTYTDK